MQKIILALVLGSAAAFQPAARAPARNVRVADAKDDLVDLAESNTDALGAAIGFWDPLGATNLDFWGIGNEGTIYGRLRHAPPGLGKEWQQVSRGRSATRVSGRQ